MFILCLIIDFSLSCCSEDIEDNCECLCLSTQFLLKECEDNCEFDCLWWPIGSGAATRYVDNLQSYDHKNPNWYEKIQPKNPGGVSGAYDRVRTGCTIHPLIPRMPSEDDYSWPFNRYRFKPFGTLKPKATQII